MAPSTQTPHSSYLHFAQTLHTQVQLYFSHSSPSDYLSIDDCDHKWWRCPFLSIWGNFQSFLLWRKIWLTKNLYLLAPLPFKGISRNSTPIQFNTFFLSQDLRQPRLVSCSILRDDLKLWVLLPPPSVFWDDRILWCWRWNPGLHDYQASIHPLSPTLQPLFCLLVWSPMTSRPSSKGERASG